MPIVPGDPFVPSVMPQGQMIYNTIDRATPDAFGGQVGQTLQQAGNMLERHADVQQQMINEASVNDVYANQFSPQFRDLYGKFYQLRGKDVAAQFPAFQEQMQDLRKQVREQLSNQMQQKAFDSISRQRIERELDGMTRHASQQLQAWDLETSNNLLGSFVQDGVDGYNDPKRLQQNEKNIRVETSGYGAGGWNPDGSPGLYGPTGAGQSVATINMRAQYYIDRMYKGAIERQLTSDPQAGIAFYNQYKSKLSGPMQSELERVIKPVQELGQAQVAYGKVTGGAMAQAIAGEAARQEVDPSTALTIWSAEGGVTNPATPNARGSPALGIFQFMPDTWADMGGTDRNRTDINSQIQLGIALTKQNSDALKKDLGRQPQPWEVYLAHQQGIGGATALLHADPSANAGDVVGNPKAITGNGGTTDTTAGQFINYIKGYVDQHSMMYAANGVPTAQNLTENYVAGLQAVTELARQEHSNDPGAEDRYRSHYLQQTGRQIHAEQVANQANWNIVRASLAGPTPVKSWREFVSDPRRLDAYTSIYRSDPSAYNVVDKAITTNAMSAWDPPATDETNQLYDNLNGMKDTDRNRFSNLNLMSYYGGMPVGQLNNLISSQDKIRNNDATEAAKHTSLQSSISAVNDLTSLAAASAESPFYKMDQTSPFPPEQQKWNGFVSKYGQALDDWQQNNSGKIPTNMQKREIAQEILFPNGMPGQPLLPAWASPTSAETAENPSPGDTNTTKNINADPNMVDSTGNVPGTDAAQGCNYGSTQHGNPREPGAAGISDLWGIPERLKDYYDTLQVLRKGNPSQKGPVDDVAAAWKYLLRPRGVSKDWQEPVPPDAVTYVIPIGDSKNSDDKNVRFKAPPEADFPRVYEAGKANGRDPILMEQCIGHFGTFDFQRDTVKKQYIRNYADASNYAVGVYMNAAGFSLEDTFRLGDKYAGERSAELMKKQHLMWTRGWNDANSGKLPNEPYFIDPGFRIDPESRIA